MGLEKKKATISDIAAAAGVSKATVSRYINGKSDLMMDKTKERIRTVIELLDYHPNNAARSLKTKKNYQVGVMLSNIETPFAASLIVGIGSGLRQRGYEPLFVDCHDSIEEEGKALASFLDRTVDGLIVSTIFMENPALIKASCDGCPIVLCDRFVNNYAFNVVSAEQEESMYRLLLHLKEQGYTRPALFTLPWAGNSNRQRRLEAFRQAIAALYPDRAREDVYLFEAGGGAEDQLERFLSQLPPGEKPAVVGINSEATVLVYRAIQRCSLRIPEDVGLCGSEDWNWDSIMNWATLLTPSITTIDVPTKQMGCRAAERLVELIEGGDPTAQVITLPCALSPRGSTQLRGGTERIDR